MIVLGGFGSVWGAGAGAIAYVFLGKLMQTIALSLPFVAKLPTGLQMAVRFSVLVIAVLVVEPLGLFGLGALLPCLAVPLLKRCASPSGMLGVYWIPMESNRLLTTPVRPPDALGGSRI